MGMRERRWRASVAAPGRTAVRRLVWRTAIAGLRWAAIGRRRAVLLLRGRLSIWARSTVLPWRLPVAPLSARVRVLRDWRTAAAAAVV